MKTKIYVAAASHPSQRRRVRAAMDAVREAEGYELAHDWLAVIERVERGEEVDRWTAAEDDVAAIRESHIVWTLIPPPEAITTGLWVELGYALACDTTIVTSGNADSPCIFVELVEAQHRFLFDSDVAGDIARGVL